ncbi:MAG: hypothetical protein ACP5H2_10495 [Solirubrobacteraceae bacterium]
MAALPAHVAAEVQRILDAAARRIALESKGPAARQRDEAKNTISVKDRHES